MREEATVNERRMHGEATQHGAAIERGRDVKGYTEH